MSKLCEYKNCKNRATYGLFYAIPLRCKEHKEEDHKSQYSICKCGKKKPTFGVINKKPECCKECKTKEMIDLNHKKCECGKSRPIYNNEDEKEPIYCKQCPKYSKDMIDLQNKSKMCKCGNRASFSLPESNEKYCKKCPEYSKDMIDIMNPKCSCGNRPIYNYPQLRPKFCKQCPEFDEEKMIDRCNSKCECGKQRPTYNFKNQPARFCKNCPGYKQEMINTHSKICKGENCPIIGNKKYKGYCSTCFQNLFPLDPLTFQIRSKTKEIAVRDYINSNFEGFHHDKPLWYGDCDCTHRRKVDHRKLIGNTLLCIETDEYQHKSYSREDEQNRYNDITMVHGGKIIFIRFNPDQYKDKKGITRNPMISSRLPVLKHEIEKQIQRIEKDENQELIEIFKLFYDENKI